MEGAEMKRRFGPSLYFASDKVIFDSLNQHQVGIESIRELLNERGIIVSGDTAKDELAKYFSRLTADYFDHKSIATKLGRVAKHERVTYSELKGKLQDTDIIDSLNALKQKLSEEGNNVEITKESGNRIIALISYEHIDYTKIDLRQVEPRDAIIEFTKLSDGEYIVRSTQNKEIDPLVEQVVEKLKLSIDTPIERSRINMESITDHVLRTKFFEQMMNDIQGYKFVTVTEAFCFKPKAIVSDDEREEEDDVEKSPYVERVGLRGEGVNRSFVIDDLYKKEYYVIKVVWRIKSTKNTDGDIMEVEAQFSSPESCTDFSYRTKSVIICEDGRQTAKKRSPKKEEQDSLFRLIEEAAKRSLVKLTATKK